MTTTKSSGSPVTAVSRTHALALVLMLAASLSLYFTARGEMPVLVAFFLGLFILANLVELLLVK